MTATEASARSAMDRLLRPRSIAIVGASPTVGSFGASILANLDGAGYRGDIYLINPKRSEIGSRPCLPSVNALPSGVDCAVLAIPRQGVVDAVRACAQSGVGAIIIFSGGFAESGAAGLAEQNEIAKIAQEHDIAIQGPNCLGMVNYLDGIPLTFVSTVTEKTQAQSGVAIVSQSGAMAAVLGVSLKAHTLDITFSISTGNEASRTVEDFAEYIVDDESTRVITMIVEHFRNPRKFLLQVQRANRLGKRMVLLHPGRSSAARASAATHTGAMAGDYELMRAKVSQAGVVMVGTLEELIDVTQLLCRCDTLPAGGCAVLTESGAFKALTLDFCEILGLRLPTLSNNTADALRQALPDFIPPTNPLDVTAQGLVDPDLYRRTLPPILADDQFGSVVLSIILTDEATANLKLPPILDALRTIKPTKPVIFAGLDEGAVIPAHYVPSLLSLGACFYPTPERAFRAIACVTRSARGLTSGGEPLLPATSHPLERGVMPEYKSKRLLSSFGIPIPAGELARNLGEALKIACEIGFPVVLKAQSPALSHKSDAGGVALNLREADSVATAWEKMQADIASARPELELDGILVEKMGRRGAELIVGARNDPDWGPVLLVGLGGVMAEILHDVRLIAPTLDEETIMSELRSLKGAPLLDGFRGSPALDIRAAAQIVACLGSIILQNPSVREVDINPVVVYPEGEGAVALDALIMVD